jgi:superfamily II DNA or RNA helicase
MVEQNLKKQERGGTSLRQLKLKPEYNTEDDMIIRDFYSPCLAASEKYDRAVGYFRANIYRELGEDLLNFVIHGGKIRMVCSPDIPEIDEEAARDGYSLRGARPEEDQEATLLHVLNDMSKSPKESDCLDMLRILIEKGVMELYVATKVGGIYHRKMGVFYDTERDYIAFSGSGNETQRAINSIEGWGNDEEFDVYRIWGTDFESHKARKKAEYFQKLINGGTKHTKIRPLNEIERDEIAKFRTYSSFEDCRPGAKSRKPVTKKEEIKGGSDLFPFYYQVQAIEEWEKNERVGMLSMATGTGKTYTALFAISKLVMEGRLVVILVPSKLLLEQWYKNVRKFYPNVPLLLAGGGNNWKAHSKKRMFVSDINMPRIILSTMSTASSDDFIAFLKQAKNPVLVADEAHSIGSPVFRKIVEKIEFKERLGLSATPERLFDEEGDAAIRASFGSTAVYNLPIGGKVKLSEDDEKEVPILGKFLSRYNYYFKIVHLTEEEQEEWEDLTSEINRFIGSHPSVVDKDANSTAGSEKLELLFINRSRILKKACGKIECACKSISEMYDPNSRWIIYCEDGDQMKAVANAIRQEYRDITVLTYHSNMDVKEKERTLLYFERHPSLIVSIRCLDEGVDIPVVDGALILASSTNPRQYIQRRGRVLRKAKGKRMATIIDAIVLPKEVSGEEGVLLPVVRSELSRAWNFAKNAENSEITHELWKIGTMYGADLDSDEQIGLREEMPEE